MLLDIIYVQYSVASLFILHIVVSLCDKSDLACLPPSIRTRAPIAQKSAVARVELCVVFAKSGLVAFVALAGGAWLLTPHSLGF